MFIYKFMAGFTDSITVAGDDEFDPHQHRKIPKPTTYGETMMHLLKGSLGAGLLAMPNAVSRVGLVFGGLGIMIIGAFATYCIQILILAQYQVCKKWRRGYIGYPASLRKDLQAGPKPLHSYGRCTGKAVDTFLCFWQIGICAIYFVFVAENAKQILESYGISMSLRWIIIYMYPILLVLSMIKDLKLLTPFSTFSNVFVVIGLVLVFFYMAEDDVILDKTKLEFTRLYEIPVFIGITLFALEAVGVVLALQYNMENPKEFTGLCGLFSISMCIIIGIYTFLGLFGFLKYGDNCKGSITLNLPQNEKKAQGAKVTFAAALFLSYPLQNFVAWQIIWRKLGKRIKGEKKKFVDWMLRIIIATLPCLMAVAAPTLGPFMGLMGALCLSMVAVIFPAILEMCVYYPNNYGTCYWRLISDIFIVVFGIFCLVSGVYTSLLEMYDTYEL